MKIIILALLALFSIKSIAQGSLKEKLEALDKNRIEMEESMREYDKRNRQLQDEMNKREYSRISSAAYLQLENNQFITRYINDGAGIVDELEFVYELKRRNEFGYEPLYKEKGYDKLLKAFRENCKKRPGKKIIGCLLGECTNGMGYYISPAGNKYIGESVANLKKGFGVMFYSDGSIYAGEWNSDRFNWTGIYINSTYTYYGEWKDGASNGKGTHTCELYEYNGKWKEGLMDGKGLIKFKNGVQYNGEFKDNKYNGLGTYTLPDGRALEGQFVDGKFVNNKQDTN